MGVTLLSCFVILRFEITKIIFYELVRNHNGLGVSGCARRIGQTPKVIKQEWM